MTEKEKQQAGMLYDANHDPEVLEELRKTLTLKKALLSRVVPP